MKRCALRFVATLALAALAAKTSHASPITFSGNFGTEFDKVFFHGVTSGTLSVDTINVISSGFAAGGFAPGISLWVPDNKAGGWGYIGTGCCDLGGDTQRIHTVSGTDYFFALSIMQNDPTSNFGLSLPLIDTPFTFDSLTGSFFCAPGIGQFCYGDPLIPRTGYWSLAFTGFDSVEKLSDPVAATPAPPSGLLLATGLGMLGWFGWRRKRMRL
jgi:hypothetical protein